MLAIGARSRHHNDHIGDAIRLSLDAGLQSVILVYSPGTRSDKTIKHTMVEYIEEEPRLILMQHVQP